MKCSKLYKICDSCYCEKIKLMDIFLSQSDFLIEMVVVICNLLLNEQNKIEFMNIEKNTNIIFKIF